MRSSPRWWCLGGPTVPQFWPFLNAIDLMKGLQHLDMLGNRLAAVSPSLPLLRVMDPHDNNLSDRSFMSRFASIWTFLVSHNDIAGPGQFRYLRMCKDLQHVSIADSPAVAGVLGPRLHAGPTATIGLFRQDGQVQRSRRVYKNNSPTGRRLGRGGPGARRAAGGVRRTVG